LERDSAADMMIELMKTIINTQQVPEEWKRARNILLFKGGEEKDNKNWRPIPITSIMYRLVFC
jgi:hypothetical protein